MEKVEKKKVGRDMHEEVKLVHEVKQEVGSRGHTENSDQ